MRCYRPIVDISIASKIFKPFMSNWGGIRERLWSILRPSRFHGGRLSCNLFRNEGLFINLKSAICNLESERISVPASPQ
jgi:hypothetical protein